MNLTEQRLRKIVMEQYAQVMRVVSPEIRVLRRRVERLEGVTARQEIDTASVAELDGRCRQCGGMARAPYGDFCGSQCLTQFAERTGDAQLQEEAGREIRDLLDQVISLEIQVDRQARELERRAARINELNQQLQRSASLGAESPERRVPRYYPTDGYKVKQRVPDRIRTAASDYAEDMQQARADGAASKPEATDYMPDQ